ncbi:MAG: class I SAM-dependent methyltransferase [bacterium]
MTPRLLDALPVPGEAPVVLHRDEDLLVVDKPAGWLTHADGSGERPDVVGFFGEPLGVHQRLDVDTTGVLLFARSPAGDALLRAAFAERRAEKRYLAVVEGAPPASEGALTGEVEGRPAETRYRVQRLSPYGALVEARPVTGRRHQIRRHLAAAGCAIRGDARYGDALDRRAPRALLHCAAVTLPDGRRFEAPTPPDFAHAQGLDPAAARAGLAADAETTAWRALDGEGDGWPGWTVDRYGDWLWVQQAAGAAAGPLPAARGVYRLDAEKDRSHGGQAPPRLVAGEAAPAWLTVYEHGTPYRVQLGDQLSTGLFLDQRPQRAWLARHAGGMRVLNTFAHAGGFSVAAAQAGATTVSVDLSRVWLDRIPPQLAALGVDPAGHDRIYGDVFDWLRRLGKRGERFDLVILDPPSTSVGTRKRRWSAARDYPELVRLALPLVAPGGWLWTATNHRQLGAARFAHKVAEGGGGELLLWRVCPPAVDFPCRGPAPVKTLVWRRG